MHEVRLRTVADGDIPSIGEIYREAVSQGTASFEWEPPGDDEMRRRFDALAAGGFPRVAALVGERLVGYAYAGPSRSRPAYRHTVEDSIYVRAEARGLGIGRQLLARLIEESERRDFRQMVAIIGDSANHGSVAVHRALGFRHTGTLEAVGWKFGRWLDSIIMQRSLGPGSDAPAA